MRRITDELFEVRTPPEQLARWALETPAATQEATFLALAFLARTEHAAASLLPVVEVLLAATAVEDSDGFRRLPRGALEQFRLRTQRATAWMEQLVFFRERFPGAVREPSPGLFGLARAFTRHGDSLEAAVDVLVRESVLPEIEELLARVLTYPPLHGLLQRLREGEASRSAEARALAGGLVGELSGQRLWIVRRRLIASTTRAILGARPLLEALERGGLKVDRARAAKGFGRRLEEAVSALQGARVIPAALVDRLAGRLQGGGRDQEGEE